MTRDECKGLMSKLDSYEGMSYALILHQDLMTGEIHSTYMLSPDDYELNYWASRRSNEYRKLNVPFAAYIDGYLEDCNNKLILED